MPGEATQRPSDIFQKCADSGDIPDLWKTSTVIPIPKTKSKDLNEFIPITLTSLVMKCFEKILKDTIDCRYIRATTVCLPSRQGCRRCKALHS